MSKSRVTRVLGACVGVFLWLSIGTVQAAPVAIAGPDILDQIEGALVQLDGSASHDTGGLPLTYLWAQTAGPVAVLFTTTEEILFLDLPIVGIDGAALTFSLTVDNGTTTDTDFVDVFIKEINNAPTADAGIDQIVGTNAFTTLDGSGSFDPDGRPLTYLWEQTMGDTVMLSDASAIMPTFTAPTTAQALGFKLTVSDSEFSSTDLVQINVSAVPLPAAAWLFGSGLLGLVGMARRKKAV